MRVVIRGAKEDREAIFKVHALLVEEGHQPVLPPEWRGEVLDPTVVAVMLGVELMEAHAVVVVTGHAGSRSAWVGGEIKTAENLNRQVVKIEASKIPDVYSTKLQLRAGLQGAHTKELPEEALAYRIAKDPARLERLRAVTKDIKPFDGSSTKAMELLKQSATPEERRVLQEIWDRAEAQCRARAEDQGWLGNPYAAGDAALEALEEVEARIERAKPPTVRPDDSYADKQLAAVLVDHFWRSSFVEGAAKIERGEATKEDAIRDFLANSSGRTHERVETLAETMGTHAAYNYIMRKARENDPRLADDIRTRAWGPPIIGG